MYELYRTYVNLSLWLGIVGGAVYMVRGGVWDNFITVFYYVADYFPQWLYTCIFSSSHTMCKQAEQPALFQRIYIYCLAIRICKIRYMISNSVVQFFNSQIIPRSRFHKHTKTLENVSLVYNQFLITVKWGSNLVRLPNTVGHTLHRVSWCSCSSFLQDLIKTVPVRVV